MIGVAEAASAARADAGVTVLEFAATTTRATAEPSRAMLSVTVEGGGGRWVEGGDVEEENWIDDGNSDGVVKDDEEDSGNDDDAIAIFSLSPCTAEFAVAWMEAVDPGAATTLEGAVAAFAIDSDICSFADAPFACP